MQTRQIHLIHISASLYYTEPLDPESIKLSRNYVSSALVWPVGPAE